LEIDELCDLDLPASIGLDCTNYCKLHGTMVTLQRI